MLAYEKMHSYEALYSWKEQKKAKFYSGLLGFYGVINIRKLGTHSERSDNTVV